jgi:DNA-binding protein
MTTENTQSTENRDSENRDSENRDSGNRDSGNRDSGNRDSGNRDSGNRDSGNRDSGNRDSGNRDIIYIGKKPLMAYVTSTLIQLANIPSVRIKARGMSIGRAVDVTQIISRKTENAGYVIGEIKLGSEALESQDGKTRNVSTIDIEVKRK